MDNFKAVLRHWSTWLIAAALAALVAAQTWPDGIIQTWAWLPDSVKTMIPADYGQNIAKLLLLLAGISKFIKQDQVAARLAQLKARLKAMAAGGGT